MKNKRLLLVLITILCVACVRDNTERATTLTVEGGMHITIGKSDVTRDITITAPKPVTSPVAINLTTDAEQEEAMLSRSTIILSEGETSVSVQITFFAEKFPSPTNEKVITVIASSTTDNIQFKPTTTSFYVKSLNKVNQPYTLTILTKSTKLNTTDAVGTAEISFSLDNASSKDLPISVTYDKSLSISQDDISWQPEEIVIPKERLSATAYLQVKQGVQGTIPLKFATSTPNVTLITKELNFTFTVDPFPDAPISLCKLTTLTRNYVLTKTFTVGNYTLTPEHRLDGYYGHEDLTATVTAKVAEGGELSIQLQNAMSSPYDSYVLAAWVDWNRNGRITDNENVLYKTISTPNQGEVIPPYTSSLKAPPGTIYGKYNMRIGVYYNDEVHLKGGCGQISNGDLIDITIDYSEEEAAEAYLSTDDDLVFDVDDKDVIKKFTVARTKPDSKPTTIHLTASSTGTDMPILSSSSITIPAGQISQKGTITFKAVDLTTSGKQSQVTLKITSASGIDIDKNASTIIYDVTYSNLIDVPPVKLCHFSTIYLNDIFTESFTVGDYTLSPKHTATEKGYGHVDMTDRVVNVREGDKIAITYGNQDSGPASYLSAAWVDWNKDGKLDNSEMLVYEAWNTTSDKKRQVLGTVEGGFKAPEWAKAGAYFMRIGSSSTRNLTGGCGRVENADMFDIKIDYSVYKQAK